MPEEEKKITEENIEQAEIIAEESSEQAEIAADKTSENGKNSADNNYILILTGILLIILQVLYMAGNSSQGDTVGTAVPNPSQIIQTLYSVLNTYVPGLLGLFFVIFGSYDFDKNTKIANEEVSDEADEMIE